MGQNKRNYNQTDLENIAKGACFLASGGGTYESGENLSNHLIKSDYYPNPTFDVINCDQVVQEDYAVVVAYMGAPEAINIANYSIADVMDENGNLSSNLVGKSASVIGIAAELFLREDDGLLPVFMQAIRRLGYYGAYKTIEKING